MFVILMFKSLIFDTNKLSALPYNFGFTQKDRVFKKINDDDFYVYFDHRVSDDGIIIINSLTHSKKVLEKWLGISRKSKNPLIVVSSPIGKLASFANFFYDSIELITNNTNVRDLTWHEYTHIMTYQHYYNFLFSAGTVIHILWMPAWFLEGLAEAITVSTGSDFQSGIERWQALTDNWPSYDRLHSLYQNPKWSARGYATSGSFLTWIIRELYINSIDKDLTIADMLKEFRAQTMPWNLLFNKLNPMDKTLKKFLGRDSKTLYQQYKLQAKEYWKEQSIYPFLAKSKEHHLEFKGGFNNIYSSENNLFSYELSKGKVIKNQFFSDDHSRYINKKNITEVDFNHKVSGFSHLTHLKTKNYQAFIKKLSSARKSYNIVNHQIYIIPSQHSPKTTPVLINTKAKIEQLFYNNSYFGWIENDLERIKICYFSNIDIISAVDLAIKLPKPSCTEISHLKNQSAQLIGIDLNPNGDYSPIASNLWFRAQSTALSGDLYYLLSFNLSHQKITKHRWDPLAKPISASLKKSDLWVLASDRTSTYIVNSQKNGACRYTLRFIDFLRGLWTLESGELIVASYQGFYSSLIKINPAKLQKHPCKRAIGHSSPLLEAMRILTINSATSKNNSSATTIDLSSSALDKLDGLEKVLFRTHPWKIKHLKQTLRLRKLGYQKKDKSRLVVQDKTSYSDERINELFEQFRALDKTIYTSKQREKINLNAHSIISLSSKQKKSSAKNSDQFLNSKNIKPYSFKWTSPVYFPWMGAQDYKGPQLGILTIPFVDHLQNHTLRGILLFGTKSYYPGAKLSYINTRYRLPITVSIFKRLTYNGNYKNDDNNKSQASYLDEIGGSISIQDYFFLLDKLSMEYIISATSSHLSHYDGYLTSVNGFRNLTSLTFSFYRFFSYRINTRLKTRFTLAPGFINKGLFDYYKSYFQLRFRKYFYNTSRITIGSELGLTRGSKTMPIKEIYTPIKIFIPGSGLASNRLRLPIGGSGSLFRTISLGDTYLRNSLELITPIVDDADKKILFFYLRSIDFKSYINYGGIWSDNLGQTISIDKMLLAYGSSVNLLMENKGVNFYSGLGMGSLHLKGIDFFINLGFEAFF